MTQRTLAIWTVQLAVAIGLVWFSRWGMLVIAAEIVAWGLAWRERRCDPNAFRLSEWPGQLYELVPSNRFAFHFDRRNAFTGGETVWNTVNSQGFRGPEPMSPKAEDHFRILVLGDSMTFGEGVEDGEEYPRLIEGRWRGERAFERPVEVINTAVGGYNTAQEAAALERYHPLYEPDMVWLAITLEDTLPWGAVTVGEDGALFRPGAPWRHRLRDFLGEASHLLWWLQRAYRYWRLDQYFPRLFQPDFPGYLEWRKALRRIVTRVGDPSRLVVFVLPVCWKLRRYPWKDLHGRIRREVEDLGVACFDLLPTFEGREPSQFWRHPLDQHPNALAHRMMADAIAGNLELRRRVAAAMAEERASCCR